MKLHNLYYIYIVTNKNKTVLYTGVTNDLIRRIAEHEASIKYFNPKSFAGKYNACFLLYYECFDNIQDAIAREKQIKVWSRSKKENLINAENPGWKFLNGEM